MLTLTPESPRTSAITNNIAMECQQHVVVAGGRDACSVSGRDKSQAWLSAGAEVPGLESLSSACFRRPGSIVAKQCSIGLES